MSTKWCPQCGSEFIARVEVCPDCEVELGTEPPGSTRPIVVAGDDGQADLELEPGDQLVYELHEWSEESRRHLDQLLTGFGSTPTVFGSGDGQALAAGFGGRGTAIPHLWQGTDLIVPVALREQAEALIDQVELGALLALDPDIPKVAYDLADLDDEQLDQIADALSAEEVPHGFDDDTGELVVHETDEEKVEAILDAVDFPDALPVDDGEGDGGEVDPLAAQDTMSDLFVAADRLRKDARDPDGMTTLVAAAERAVSLPLPYGFAEADWKAIVEAAQSVASLVQADDADDERLEEAADALRTLLRPYV